MEKITPKHEIIRSLRFPISLIFVCVFVFSYCLNSFAATNTFSDTVTYSSRYNLDSSTTYPELTSSNISTYANANGFDTSVLNGGIWNTINGTRPSFDVSAWNTFLKNTMVFPNTLTSDGITYDIENAYTLIIAGQNWVPSCSGFLVWGSGNIGLVNNFIVSDQDFYYFYVTYYNSSGVSWGGSNGLVHVTQQQANGLYHFEFTSAMNSSDAIYFSDLSMYGSSSDGSSGFSTYSASNTDFSFSGNNYDFNFLKTGFNIIAPADPVPEPEPENVYQGQFYNYAGINGYFQGWSQTAVLWVCNFSMNEYMRLHPEEYQVKIQYTANIDKANANINVPVTYDAIEYIPLSYVTGNGSTYNLKRVVNFNSLTAVSDSSTTLSDGLENIYTSVTGIDPQYYTDFNFWTFEGTQYSNNPKFALNRSLNSTVRDVYINAAVNLIWDPENDGEDETISGVYRKRISLLDGSEQVMENTISNNYNPPEVVDPQYPAGLNSAGSVSTGSGTGGSVSFNPTVTNSFNALVEYLFHIDTDNLLTMQGNMADQYNFVMSKITDNGENGFLTLLSESYDIIPSEIWDWIKAAVGMVLLACTWKIFISNKRLTG